ncbi:hypothetical protein OsJ_35996 [Oryza sativa Japonica Group]|uniref:Uncharacterized protein n=1 Tax=Oryza sativa subsp. japonica TaxID=39947 RepID=A3CH26_ORYSJ|nr:hypothetical protein OsJ_35996 [Oryza sativa Japonica Group]
MSKRQAILKTIWSPLAAVLRPKNCAATSRNLIVVNAGGEIIAGGGREDATVTRKSRSSLEDLLKIEASTNPPETKAAADPQPADMATPAINLSKEERTANSAGRHPQERPRRRDRRPVLRRFSVAVAAPSSCGLRR